MGAYHWEQCNRASRNYNPPLEARYEVVVREVRRWASLDTVLDLGCGDGYLMAQASPYAKRIIGIDTEVKGVHLAKHMLATHDNCEVYLGNGYDLPFPDNSFDAVLLADVIEHLVHPDACLGELRRVLKPGRGLWLTTPKWRPDRMWDERHIQEFKPQALQALLERYFGSVRLSFFWPIKWTNFYSTQFGWKLVKHIARRVNNPFYRESDTNPERFGQIKAVCCK
ncbi:MAG: class I SAM-dependent methyltransferase [Candidatus Tectomicrobia bacterium]|nr:class I SAM-dependent methyltransferase [Candidatus Tectomicrobia bacterium]